ncbi:MAG: hypothetical protein EOO22_00140 [Comamonadaceae bacterium]|nr:MAG: hypothetical protein EOO22_00140 [Comamonadaceae bacterium]
MNATTPTVSYARLGTAARLAQLLERLEHSAVPVGADQYRSVVTHLVDEFAQVEQSAPADGLARLLDAFPAASELYENLHYGQAGLCRTALDTQLAAELRAKEVIARARRASAAGDGA